MTGHEDDFDRQLREAVRPIQSAVGAGLPEYARELAREFLCSGGLAGHGWRVDHAVAGLLGSQLHDGWRGGWQPLDLHRLVAYRLSKRHLEVLTRAIADEMCCYPTEKVDRRWRVQLAEIDALPTGIRAPTGSSGCRCT